VLAGRPGERKRLGWVASGMCRQSWLISTPSCAHRRRCLRGCDSCESAVIRVGGLAHGRCRHHPACRSAHLRTSARRGGRPSRSLGLARADTALRHRPRRARPPDGRTLPEPPGWRHRLSAKRRAPRLCTGPRMWTCSASERRICARGRCRRPVGLRLSQSGLSPSRRRGAVVLLMRISPNPAIGASPAGAWTSARAGGGHRTAASSNPCPSCGPNGAAKR
jgi:hypothetical protein